MKKLKTILNCILLLLPILSFGQNDVILKTNGEEMIGKIIKINEQDLQFVYQKETIEYNVQKTDIVKITFSSGRIEYYKKKGETTSAQLESHHNNVAILPFGYIKDQETSNIVMSQKIQQETYSIFKKNASSLKFQDPNTTNALLNKAGVSNTIAGYTMGEICTILGVEYVVQGLVSVERSTITNYSNSNSTIKNNKNAYVDRNGNIVGNPNEDSKRTTSTYGSSAQNYVTSITMNLYTDKGENVFNMDHQAFWQTQDAYKITLQYLVKRTPLFKK